MSIAVDKTNMLQGFDAGIGASPNNTMVINTSQAVVAGATIFIGVVWWASGANNVLTGVTGGGLTWNIDVQDNSPVGGGNPNVAIVTAHAPSGLATNTPITFTWDTGAGGAAAAAGSSFTGLPASGFLSAVGAVDGDTSTGWASDVVAVPANGLLFSVCYNSTVSASGWSNPTTGTELVDYGDANFAGLVTQYQIPSSAGSYGNAGDNVGTETWTAIGASYIALSGQKAYASADSVDGAWTDQAGGTSLFAAIDETSPSDSDYIKSELNPNNSGCRVKLGTLSTPQSGTRTLSWRIGKDATGGAQMNMKIQLRQGGGNSLGGGTLVQEFTRNNVDAATTYDESVTGTITDYADLYVEFYATQV